MAKAKETTVVNVKKRLPLVDPPYVYIGRGSPWGNPFTHLPLAGTKAAYQVATREEAIEKYREWILKQPALLKRLGELKGKVLGCYCKPQSCHGDVLVELIEERCK